MVGKRVKFDDETWEAVVSLVARTGMDFQKLVDEAFSDLLTKHKQPVGLWHRLKKVSARAGRRRV
jgi:hypothetical protein